jgi:hypothetical protein
MPRPPAHHIPLNLKLPADRVRIGKTLAQRHGTTVSTLVSDVFGALARMEQEPMALDPILERLAGMVPDPGLGRQSVVMEALEQKYGRDPRP